MVTGFNRVVCGDVFFSYYVLCPLIINWSLYVRCFGKYVKLLAKTYIVFASGIKI